MQVYDGMWTLSYIAILFPGVAILMLLTESLRESGGSLRSTYQKLPGFYISFMLVGVAVGLVPLIQLFVNHWGLTLFVWWGIGAGIARLKVENEPSLLPDHTRWMNVLNWTIDGGKAATSWLWLFFAVYTTYPPAQDE